MIGFRPFVLVVWGGFLIPLLLSGCRNDEPARLPQSPVAETSADEKLTPEAARAALLTVDGEGHEFQGMGWKILEREAKAAPIKVLDERTYELGLWHFNLTDKTFEGTVIFPKAHYHHFNSWHGVFERTPEGKWRAKLTGSSSEHGHGGE